MQISAKTDYACKAVLELALHWPNEKPLQIQDIANRRNVPMKFLTQILIHLKQLGFVQSVRGKHGGYLLMRQPKAITLGAVIEAFGGIQFCTKDLNRKRNDIMTVIFKEVDDSVLAILENINFENICNRKRSYDNVVTFEI